MVQQQNWQHTAATAESQQAAAVLSGRSDSHYRVPLANTNSTNRRLSLPFLVVGVLNTEEE